MNSKQSIYSIWSITSDLNPINPLHPIPLLEPACVKDKNIKSTQKPFKLHRSLFKRFFTNFTVRMFKSPLDSNLWQAPTIYTLIMIKHISAPVKILQDKPQRLTGIYEGSVPALLPSSRTPLFITSLTPSCIYLANWILNSQAISKNGTFDYTQVWQHYLGWWSWQAMRVRPMNLSNRGAWRGRGWGLMSWQLLKQ